MLFFWLLLSYYQFTNLIFEVVDNQIEEFIEINPLDQDYQDLSFESNHLAFNLVEFNISERSNILKFIIRILEISII